jgi:acetyl esterase/lipase
MSWHSRFRTPHLLTARAVTGDPDWALIVTNDLDSGTGQLINSSTGERGAVLRHDVGYESVVTPDRRWLIQLDDGGGSEVGHLRAYPLGDGPSVDLTPGRDAYVMRGVDFSADGRSLLISIVDEEGYHLLLVPVDTWEDPILVASTRNEAWYGKVSADGTLASFDTTDHNPGIRRAAVSVFSTADGRLVGVLDDLPAGPVRATRFSSVVGDPRLLVSTERSGFARPAIWNPVTGERVDFDLADLAGEVHPLDWHAASGRLLAVHVSAGIQRLLVIDEATGTARIAREGFGSYANPDVATSQNFYSTSYFATNGDVVAFEESWDVPPHLLRIASDGSTLIVVPPADVPTGRPFASDLITSVDGTAVQLWWALPVGIPKGTILDVHGGPNLVTADVYSPSAQAWLDEGYAFASLNYRGSVTFGRDFREGFWGSAGDREIEDVTAALDWLAARGLADPRSTFITGPSYGGHLTLLSLGRLPERFAGGFAHVAMADWAAAFADMNPAVRSVWLNFLRDTDGDLDAAIAHFSPISYVDSVIGSAWLFQGARDTRTPPAQAQGYVDRLRARGGDALIEWYDAGHDPVGLQGFEEAQARMLELAELSLQGKRWSGQRT